MNTSHSSTPKTAPKVLAFDVFGTVVDWHGGIAREVQALRPQVDGDAFALAWRAGYQPAMRRVMSGELGWTLIDDLHRLILEGIVAQFGLADLTEAEKKHLNKAWHRLQPWPDVVVGLTRLKSRHVICTLSNGNLGLLAEMAKGAGLPWDCILSAEVFRAYKPDPATYLGVAKVFDVAPADVMLVAAHQDDLAAARACGLQTAYIERPAEFGAARPKDVTPHADNTRHARDFLALADQLGC
ncbi:haloacid dehalogenase type II [Polaromonas sp.]|jgi:2-haloacid dehalogenase|uniref:haloacid dehalogenase type II n=1 Tax=Polaromonas sp. TaxID=1869339 RepID=UPI002C6163D3|nr:haloacid dehalogenase type II [Polaromonas sp.]HQS33259.1 haloacid dehalogenase type II [Polaromonas sp.]HQS92640.1 haloacid dehalogenase type II [Polaromonas sp.]